MLSSGIGNLKRGEKPNDVRNASLLLVSLAKNWVSSATFGGSSCFSSHMAGSAGGGWVFIVTAMQVASFTFLCVLEN